MNAYCNSFNLKIKIYFIVSLFIFLFVACSDRNEIHIVDQTVTSRIDSTLQAFVASGDLAGVMALIFEKDNEVYFNAFGMADREANIAMNRNTIVQIYSMTKPVTGVALMQLYEQGLFDLDDPLSKYASEFSDMSVYTGNDASGNPVFERPNREITIRDLTRHTAGFAPGIDVEGVGRYLRDADPMNLENTLTEMAERLGSVPLWFHPGERWSYGPSVDVQAFLVERLSGIPFNEYLQKNIFDPLNMNDTGYLIRDDDRDRFAALYHRSDDGILSRVPDEQSRALNTRNWNLTPGGFGLISTIDDYMRFARMLVNDGELDGVRILQPETVQLMATNHLSEDITDRSWLPTKGSVGFGINFAVRTDPPASAGENYGIVGEYFWDGYASTMFWVDPVNELAAILFVQLIPFDEIGLHKSFRDAVYGGYAVSE